jgi:hypothetical protein
MNDGAGHPPDVELFRVNPAVQGLRESQVDRQEPDRD